MATPARSALGGARADARLRDRVRPRAPGAASRRAGPPLAPPRRRGGGRGAPAAALAEPPLPSGPPPPDPPPADAPPPGDPPPRSRPAPPAPRPTDSGRRASPWPLLDALDDAKEALEPGDRSRTRRTGGAKKEAMHWTISDPAPDDPREGPSTVLRHAARAAGVSDAMARELLDMGAVYVDELPEGPGPTATRSKKSGGGQEEAARVKWRRCANDPGAILAPGRRLRIHKDPRRYRDGCWLGADEWRARTIHECADYLVVNKPARLPTQAHESNATECVVGCAERGLGLEPGALRVTHRLDASTSGVVVLGKSKAAVAAFNASVHAERALLTVDPLKDDERSSNLPTDDEAAPRSSDAASGTDDSSGGSSAEKAGSSSSSPPSISKTYVALTRGASPLPLGSVTHWMYPGPFGADAVELGGVKKSQARPLRSVNVRGELRYKGEVRAANWKRCRLVVLSCERAEPNAARKWEKAHAQHLKLSHKKEPVVATECIGTESDPVVMWEVRVRLLTGRTHQIRAQLAALGHPICGDSLYAPMKGFLLESAGRELEPGNPRGTVHGADPATVAEAARRIAAGVVPDWPVALHAEALEWGERAFYAPPPWREDVDSTW